MNKRKILLYAVIVVVVTLLVVFIYRFKFEFNNDKVKSLIQEEADKYGSNSASVYEIIHENVQHILKSSDLTKQVRLYAKANNLPKEKVLVDRAVIQAQNDKYIK